jgi:Fuc2NAc and GlcNAc transferase
MRSSVLWLACIASSFAIVGLVRRAALTHGVLDYPNVRSSHHHPTPRGGGLGIAITTVAALWLLWLNNLVDWPLFSVIALGGGLVAVTGAIDDVKSLSVPVRLAVHLLVAGASIYQLQWVGTVQVGNHFVELGIFGYVLGLLGIVWTLNLFNFADGIDGFAASEAIFITCAWLILELLGGDEPGSSGTIIVFAGACAGFLLWNWPPAKIFMGDIGSGFLGFVIAVLALHAAQEDPAALFVWLTLGAAFFADATVTLIRRMLRGAAISQAHHSHAYQILARRWNSHRAVTLAVLGLNIVILLPMAWLATVQPSWAAAIAFGTVVVLGAVAWALGAGTEGSVPRQT